MRLAAPQAPGILADVPQAHRYLEAAKQPYPHDVVRCCSRGKALGEGVPIANRAGSCFSCEDSSAPSH